MPWHLSGWRGESKQQTLEYADWSNSISIWLSPLCWWVGGWGEGWGGGGGWEKRKEEKEKQEGRWKWVPVARSMLARCHTLTLATVKHKCWVGFNARWKVGEIGEWTKTLRSSVRFHLDCTGSLDSEPKTPEFSLLDLGLGQMECISEQWKQTKGKKKLGND